MRSPPGDRRYITTETGTPAGFGKELVMMSEGGPGWSGHYSIYTIEQGGHPLSVECRACGHRALVATAVLRRQRDIDVMTPLKRLRVKCQCGSRDWWATIFDRPDDLVPVGAIGRVDCDVERLPATRRTEVLWACHDV